MPIQLFLISDNQKGHHFSSSVLFSDSLRLVRAKRTIVMDSNGWYSNRKAEGGRKWQISERTWHMQAESYYLSCIVAADPFLPFHYYFNSLTIWRKLDLLVAPIESYGSTQTLWWGWEHAWKTRMLYSPAAETLLWKEKETEFIVIVLTCLGFFSCVCMCL